MMVYLLHVIVTGSLSVLFSFYYCVAPSSNRWDSELNPYWIFIFIQILFTWESPDYTKFCIWHLCSIWETKISACRSSVSWYHSCSPLQAGSMTGALWSLDCKELWRATALGKNCKQISPTSSKEKIGREVAIRNEDLWYTQKSHSSRLPFWFIRFTIADDNQGACSLQENALSLICLFYLGQINVAEVIAATCCCKWSSQSFFSTHLGTKSVCWGPAYGSRFAGHRHLLGIKT